jgi:hypothetical protein
MVIRAQCGGDRDMRAAERVLWCMQDMRIM